MQQAHLLPSFGGDPDRVMIYGQSGGGSKVTTLMGMPSAAVCSIEPPPNPEAAATSPLASSRGNSPVWS